VEKEDNSDLLDYYKKWIPLWGKIFTIYTISREASNYAL